MTPPPSSPVAIIPARLGSERFPRKVLAAETGKPLIVHVCEAAARSSQIRRVVVAADAQEIIHEVVKAGFEAVLTRPDHANGTSRLAEAAGQLGLDNEAIVLNVQGDEPEIEPGVIDAALDAIDRSEAPVATVASAFCPKQDHADPNLVKVVLDQTGHALLFTRASVPFQRDESAPIRRLRHIGIYAYRAWFLGRVPTLPATPLEQAEQLEQLRFMEHGYKIAVAVRESTGTGIDTPEQYQAFVNRYRLSHGG